MKLHQLQEQLKLKNIEAFLVTRNNMFLNQDVKDKENQLMALSGFTGSQGYMLVTPDKAWLFVDSRYSIQARLETDSDKIEVIDIKSFSGAITSILKENNINNLTVNPWCISVNDWDKYTKNGINLIEEENLVQNIFLGPKEIFEHNVKYSGLSSQEKAKQIAENIKKMVTSGEILQSKGRPLQYKDFLILVQRRNSFVDEMVRACKNVGVSIAGVDKIKLQEQIVVNDLIALAKFALLPDDDLNLACVLKTPILGLDDKDLFELCYGRGNSTVWQRIRENSNYLKQVEILADLCQKGKELRPFEFFAYILAKLGGRKIFVERLGPDCEDAMDEFVNLCFDFERDHIPSLQMFVEWMEGDEVEVKRNLEQSDNDAVRLMTVHGSKGLQAPIVILPDTVRVKTASQEARWLASEDVLFYPLSKDYYDDNCNMLLEKEKNSMLDEYHRLLYVALTRAEERLCVCGYRRKNTPSEECWYEICKKAFEPIALKDNDRLVYNVEQLVEPDEKKSEFRENKAVIVPDWAKKDAEKDEVLAKPLTPSHQEDDEGAVLSPLMLSNDSKLYNRGRIIHKMLQFLPNVKKENRKRAADEFLVNQLSDMPPEELEKIALEVVGLIDSDKFASLFGENSRAEVSLMGQVDDRIVTGQIDRLVIEKDRVLIVDYKTNRPAAQTIDDVPKAYLKQMRAYRELIKRIYPDKKVETYILWTNTAKIMRIE